MKCVSLLTVVLWLVSAVTMTAAEPTGPRLPFAPDVVSRLSLDGKPRSLSIRQGADVWLGYDLERATVFKAWQAPPGKPGLTKSGFTTRSTGTTWFDDTSNAAWELRRKEQAVPLAIRYLGCSQRTDHIELRWELRHEAGTLTLWERVPLIAAKDKSRAVRELRVETLATGESLLLPAPVLRTWKLSTDQNVAAPALTGTQWHRLTLP
jgi:hypothetical protein